MIQIIINDKTVDLNDLIDRAADKYIRDNSYFSGNPVHPDTAFITLDHSRVAYALGQEIISILENLTVDDLTRKDLNLPTIATRNGRIIKRDLVAA